jgi:hypothetical protein
MRGFYSIADLEFHCEGYTMKALSLITLIVVTLAFAGCRTHRGGISSNDNGLSGMHYDRYDSRNVNEANVNDDLANPPRRNYTAPLSPD